MMKSNADQRSLPENTLQILFRHNTVTLPNMKRLRTMQSKAEKIQLASKHTENLLRLITSTQ